MDYYIWKSDEKIAEDFFQTMAISVLLYGCTTIILSRNSGSSTKKKTGAARNFPLISLIIQIKRTRHAGHCCKSKEELIRDGFLWTPTHGHTGVGSPAKTYINQLCGDSRCHLEDPSRAKVGDPYFMKRMITHTHTHVYIYIYIYEDH